MGWWRRRTQASHPIVRSNIKHTSQSLARRSDGPLACVVYATIPSFWLLIHPHADYWRLRKRSPYRLLIPVWLGMGVLLAVITAPYRKLSLYTAAWTWAPAVVLFAAGLWIYKRSAAGFSTANSAAFLNSSSGHRDNTLVTSGIRAGFDTRFIWTFVRDAGLEHRRRIGGLLRADRIRLVTGALMIRWRQGTGAAVRRALPEYRQRVPPCCPGFELERPGRIFIQGK